MITKHVLHCEKQRHDDEDEGKEEGITGIVHMSSFTTTTTTTTTGTPKQEPPTPAPTPTSTDDIRRENAELRRSLHRLRSDAKIVADAHDKLVETCNALERELDVERERSSELEEKVRALADQLKSVGGHSGSFFSP